MKELTRSIHLFVSLLLSLGDSFVTAVLGTLRRIIASIRTFDRNEINPPALERLDHRLGLIGGRVSPGVAHALGQLAADQPQQAAIAQLKQQFGIGLSVYAYRGVR